MRKLIGVLILILGWLVSAGQGTKENFFGKAEYDGFQKVEKGAFWVKRPEAKKVYEGQTPEGIEVKNLESDYFVRFVKAEHNNSDINYITFPKGEKIYLKEGKWFAAVCGNQLEFWKPVDFFRVIHDSIFVDIPARDTTKVGSGTTIINNTTKTVNNYYGTKKDTTINKSLENLRGQKDSVKWYETTVAGIVGGLIIGGVASYFIFKKEKTPPPKPYVPPVIIPPVIIPPVIIPPEPRTMPPGIPGTTPETPNVPGIPSDPRNMPPGIPGTTLPETPTTPTTPEPETPSTPGLGAEPRGMPSGIGQTFFPAGKIVTIGLTFPAPWGR